jgi:hypothetical protein
MDEEMEKKNIVGEWTRNCKHFHAFRAFKCIKAVFEKVIFQK